jgi:very-short-patch-repair endonuclease
MVRAGYTVVRFTWEEVMFDPDHVRAVLTDLVARGPRGGAVRH